MSLIKKKQMKNQENQENQEVQTIAENQEVQTIAENQEVQTIAENQEVQTIAENQEVQTIAKEEKGLASFDFDEMEKKPDSDFMEITAEYFTPEEGIVYNFICSGIEHVDRFDGKEGKQAVVTLFDKERRKYISAATLLVNAVSRFLESNPNKTVFPMRVICTGKEKGKDGGFYHVLKVSVF